ncbi:alpha/beta hydrolase [Candidatus Marinamargulisbacteria bacterium SCGC AG-414-C22]|nr:alpha/beta hydrolase [Candidatus Marinamargulisbacteria bacterium SCGC AG-414-C22]
MLAYKEFGSGQPLVILHGFLGSSDNWRTIAKQLASDFHVFALDARNHGQSFHNNDISYSAMAQDLASFMTTHNIKNPILVGHSMGGKTVMQYATQTDAAIKALIVLDIAPVSYANHHGHILKSLNQLSLTTNTTLPDLDRALADRISEPPMRQFLLKNIDRSKKPFCWKINLAALTQNYPAIMEAPIFSKKITTKTCFIKAENSGYILPDHESIIHTHFTHYDIITLSGVGHWLHAEKPTDVIKLIKEYS